MDSDAWVFQVRWEKQSIPGLAGSPALLCLCVCVCLCACGMWGAVCGVRCVVCGLWSVVCAGVVRGV